MTPLCFKYKQIDARGREIGWLASRGELNGETILLDKNALKLDTLAQLTRWENRLAFCFNTERGNEDFAIAVRGGLARPLKERVDSICSRRWCEEQRAALAARGLEHRFRTKACPNCSSLVNLSGFEETPQFYCPYCETLIDSDAEMPIRSINYGICEQCHFYARPRLYTRVDFVFLCVAFIIRTRTRACCHACMRRDAWKALGFNLPSLLGLPDAIAGLIKAYSGWALDSVYPELDAANLAATRGNLAKAQKLYYQMLERNPVAAGIRYNLARAKSLAGDWENSLNLADESLADCSNYAPSGRLISESLERLGDPYEAKRFIDCWGKVEAPNGDDS